MSNFLFNILAWIKGWTGDWGWSIVVFTIMIRVALTYFDVKSRVSMRKTSKLQPQMAALQKKYANDREKLNQKTAELYKKEHVNPLSSCLPMLLTWPILIAVFSAMRTVANKELLQQVTVIMNGEYTGQPLTQWLWIKNLWMADSPFAAAVPDLRTLQQVSGSQWTEWFNGLTAAGQTVPEWVSSLNLTVDSFTKANLGTTIQSIYEKMCTLEVYTKAVADKPGWTIPLLITTLKVKNSFNGLLILPIMSAVSQLLMTKLTGANQQPQANPNQPGSGAGKFMQWFFPIFSLFICLSYSAAFALYWVAGNLVSMAQTFIINKVLDKKEAAALAAAGEGTKQV